MSCQCLPPIASIGHLLATPQQAGGCLLRVLNLVRFQQPACNTATLARVEVLQYAPCFFTRQRYPSKTTMREAVCALLHDGEEPGISHKCRAVKIVEAARLCVCVCVCVLVECTDVL